MYLHKTENCGLHLTLFHFASFIGKCKKGNKKWTKILNFLRDKKKISILLTVNNQCFMSTIWLIYYRQAIQIIFLINIHIRSILWNLIKMAIIYYHHKIILMTLRRRNAYAIDISLNHKELFWYIISHFR